MNLIIYADGRFLTKENTYEYFILRRIYGLCEQYPSNSFTFLTYDKEPELPVNARWIQRRSSLSEKLMGKSWRKYGARIKVKKLQADILITLDGEPLPVQIPQIILLSENADKRKVKKILKHIKTNSSCAVIAASDILRKVLLKNGFPEARAFVLPQSPSHFFQAYNWDQKEQVRQRYSLGKAYFLLSASSLSQDQIIMTLKAFTQFKKWQQSNMQILVVGKLAHTRKTMELLLGYKYKDDVKVLNKLNSDPEYPGILASSMTLIYFPGKYPSEMVINEALQSGVPVMVVTPGGFEEKPDEPVLYCNTNDIQTLANRMVKLYKDEAYRLKLIEKGKDQVFTLSEKNVQDALWKHIQGMVAR